MFGRSIMRWSVGRGGGKPLGSSRGKTSANLVRRISLSGARTSVTGTVAGTSGLWPFFFFRRPFALSPGVGTGHSRILCPRVRRPRVWLLRACRPLLVLPFPGTVYRLLWKQVRGHEEMRPKRRLNLVDVAQWESNGLRLDYARGSFALANLSRG